MTAVETVLLVDDDRDYHLIFRDFFELAFGDGDFLLISAEGLEDTLALIEQQPPAVAIIDYRLGGQTGLDVANEVRRAGSDAAFILLTGTEDEFVAKASLALDAAETLTKDEIQSGLLARCIRHAVEARRHRQELRAALQQAQQAASAKANFLAGLSHELRTPLNGIIGFTDLLKLLGPTLSQEKINGYLDNISQSSAQLLGHIDNLLIYSDNLMGITPRQEEVDLDWFFQRLVDRTRVLCRGRGISLHFRGPSRGSRIVSDPSLLTLMVRPILDNAVQFTERGGQIDIAVWLVAAPSKGAADDDRPQPEKVPLAMEAPVDGGVDVAAAVASAGSVEATPVVLGIAVTDTGIGMDKTTIEEATSPFFRRADAQTAGPSGVGVGLSLAQQSLKSLGGQFAIESVPGVGTTVTMSIPTRLRIQAMPEEITAAERL